jgi:TfoX/Sxy family transcriptional regulator of competence genes
MDRDPKSLRTIFEAAAPPDLELSFRAMFGGLMAYAAGRPLASLSNVGVALKFAGADHAAFAALPGVVPLRYEPDAPPSKSYLVVPDAMLGDATTLRPWIARSTTGLTAPKRR